MRRRSTREWLGKAGGSLADSDGLVRQMAKGLGFEQGLMAKHGRSAMERKQPERDDALALVQAAVDLESALMERSRPHASLREALESPNASRAQAEADAVFSGPAGLAAFFHAQRQEPQRAGPASSLLERPRGAAWAARAAWGAEAIACLGFSDEQAESLMGAAFGRAALDYLARSVLTPEGFAGHAMSEAFIRGSFVAPSNTVALEMAVGCVGGLALLEAFGGFQSALASEPLSYEECHAEMGRESQFFPRCGRLLGRVQEDWIGDGADGVAPDLLAKALAMIDFVSEARRLLRPGAACELGTMRSIVETGILRAQMDRPPRRAPSGSARSL